MINPFKHFHDSVNIVLILAPGCEFFTAKCVQFFFNIYGMKLNEGYFTTATFIY